MHECMLHACKHENYEKISIVIQMTLPTWNIHIFHLCVTTFYVNDNVICVYIYICIYIYIYSWGARYIEKLKQTLVWFI